MSIGDVEEPLEVIEFGALTAAQRAELEGDEPDPFDSAGNVLTYRSKERHVGLREPAGRLVASTGIVLAEVEVDDSRFPVVGLGGVIVNAAHRGRGRAREVVEAALEAASALGPRFAILFCHTDRAGLYLKLGFTEITAEVRVQQPAGFARMPEHTMWRGLTPDTTWPEGRVVVHSLPF